MPAAIGPDARSWRSDRKEGSRRLVLLVEDEPHELQIYGGVLLYNGFDVAYARDGATALEFAAHHRLDLVILDLGLPDVHGFDLCARLRRMAPLQDVPVLVLSASSRHEFGETAVAMGCSDFLEKPIGPVEVLHVAERLLGRQPLAGLGEPPRIVAAGPGAEADQPVPPSPPFTRRISPPQPAHRDGPASPGM